jgi:hypothetical protein
LSAPSAVHSYRVPGKFIRRLKSLFVGNPNNPVVILRFAILTPERLSR